MSLIITTSASNKPVIKIEEKSKYEFPLKVIKLSKDNFDDIKTTVSVTDNIYNREFKVGDSKLMFTTGFIESGNIFISESGSDKIRLKLNYNDGVAVHKKIKDVSDYLLGLNNTLDKKNYVVVNTKNMKDTTKQDYMNLCFKLELWSDKKGVKKSENKTEEKVEEKVEEKKVAKLIITEGLSSAAFKISSPVGSVELKGLPLLPRQEDKKCSIDTEIYSYEDKVNSVNTLKFIGGSDMDNKSFMDKGPDLYENLEPKKVGLVKCLGCEESLQVYNEQKSKEVKKDDVVEEKKTEGVIKTNKPVIKKTDAKFQRLFVLKDKKKINIKNVSPLMCRKIMKLCKCNILFTFKRVDLKTSNITAIVSSITVRYSKELDFLKEFKKDTKIVVTNDKIKKENNTTVRIKKTKQYIKESNDKILEELNIK